MRQSLFQKRTNQVQSARLEKAENATSLLNMTTRITYEKYDGRFPGVLCVLILRVFYFLVKHSRPYYKTEIKSLRRYITATHCLLYDNLQLFTEVEVVS